MATFPVPEAFVCHRLLRWSFWLAVWVGYQKDRSVHWSELLPALGVAGGPVVALGTNG